MDYKSIHNKDNKESNTTKPLKKFGQHFLRNKAKIELILDEISPGEGDIFLEIGPGQGALTIPLCERLMPLNAMLIALEVDERMIDILEPKLCEYPNAQIIHQDALTAEIAPLVKTFLEKSADGKDIKPKEIQQRADQIKASLPEPHSREAQPETSPRAAQQKSSKLRIIGNLPYNISVPLIEKFLLLANFAIDSEDDKNTLKKKIPGITGPKNKRVIKDMHFMVQREIANRLSAPVGSTDYGRLAIMMEALGKLTKITNLASSDFIPQPKVRSTFIRIEPRISPLLGGGANSYGKAYLRYLNLKHLVQYAFTRPNRRVHNNLKAIACHPETGADIGLAIERNPYKDAILEKRAKDISLRDYLELLNFL